MIGFESTEYKHVLFIYNYNENQCYVTVTKQMFY